MTSGTDVKEGVPAARNDAFRTSGWRDVPGVLQVLPRQSKAPAAVQSTSPAKSAGLVASGSATARPNSERTSATRRVIYEGPQMTMRPRRRLSAQRRNSFNCLPAVTAELRRRPCSHTASPLTCWAASSQTIQCGRLMITDARQAVIAPRVSGVRATPANRGASAELKSLAA
jgi:hypothetical protein